MKFQEKRDQNNSGEAVIHSLVPAIAAVTDEDPLSLPPLQDAVDLEALQRIIQSSGFCSVEFPYADHKIAIKGPTHVTVTPVE